MPLVLRPATERTYLPERLASLGRARRRASTAAGWFKVFAVGLVALALACGLDIALHLPGLVRAMLLVLILTTIGVAYFRWVRSPGREPIHPLAIALRLEESFPRLNDSLASAVDFLHSDPTVSNRFRRVAVTRAENLAGRYDLDSIVPAGRAWRAFWLAVLAVAIVVPLGLIRSSTTQRALIRLADPFGRHPWPTRTIVEVLQPQPRSDGRFLLAKGESFPLRFIVRGELPEHATVTVRLVGGAALAQTLSLPVQPDQTEVTAELHLEPDLVTRDFEFQIAANDFESDWFSVIVAPAPKLVLLDDRPSPHIRLTFPTYTDLAMVELPPGTGVIEAVAGTRIHFRAAADRRIVLAELVPHADRAGLAVALSAINFVSDHPLAPLAAQMLAAEAIASIPVQVTGPEGTELQADFIPHLPGLYSLRFTDESGLTGIRTFDFRIFPDPSPLVVLERPAPGRDALTLLPTASILVRARSEDRPYAVKALAVEYRVGGSDAAIQKLQLTDLELATALLPAIAGPGISHPRPVSLDGNRTIPITLLRKPDGSLPADGDVILLRAVATDWDDRTALKEPGRSKDVVEILVLARSSLESLFEEKLAALRPELMRVREEQRAARVRTTELAKSLSAGKLTPSDWPLLNQLEQDQRGVKNKVADPTAGLRTKADELRETARTNRLPRSPTTDKIEAIADELGQAADRHLEAVEPQLAAARQEAESTSPDSKKLFGALEQADRHQKAAEAALTRAIDRLEQWSGPGEIRGQARHLRDQLNKAGEQANRAAEKVPAGTPQTRLSPSEKAELAAPAARLDDVADQAAELMARTGRIADEKEAQARADRAAASAKDDQAKTALSDATGSNTSETARAESLRNEAASLRQKADREQAEADVLRKAVRDTGDGLPQDLRRAADTLRDNQPNESAKARQSAADKLERLTDGLTERPRETPTELRKKRDQLGEAIDRLAQEQDELRKKARTAESIDDPTQKAEELAKLAREQQRLARQAEQLAEKLTRERADKPAQAVRRAAEEMEAARNELEQGLPSTEKQDEALDRLDEALQKIDQEQKQDQEQLTREQREQILQQLKSIRDKQKAALDEGTRIQDAVLKAKEWDRGLEASLNQLAAERERPLAGELRQYAEKSLVDLPVFQRLAFQSAEAMERATRTINERLDDLRNRDTFDPETEKLSGDRMLRPMQTALRRLDQILDTLRDDPKPKDQTNAGGGSGAGGAGGSGGGAGESGQGIPPLAQLKALRAMQAEVNERTAAFAKAHPDPDKLTDDEKDELKELEQAQRDVAELFDKLAPMFRPQAPEIR